MKKFDKNKEIKKFNLKLNKEKYIKYGTIGICCLVLIVGIVMFAFAYFETKSPNYTLIHGEVEGSSDVNILAIYKGDEKVDEIPAKGSGWLFDRAECSNGATAEWNFDKWAILISTTAKTKCTLYFEEGQLAVDYINAIAPTTDSLVDDETSDHNIRYIGANPDNYVSFNNELWRIIGVMNNIETSTGETHSLLKIRRVESLGNYSWDTSASSVNTGRGINEWSQSDLMQELNYDYLGNVVVGTDGYWFNGNNNTKTAPKPSATINSEAQNMIENVKWNLGTPNNIDGTELDYYDDNNVLISSYVYTKERSNYTGKICSNSESSCNDTVTRKTTWTGKVALLYGSDYMYATAGGNSTNRTTCLITSERSWHETSVSDCKNNDWLYDSTKIQWLLSPCATSSAGIQAYIIGVVGNVFGNPGYGNGGIFPVIFLKSSVSITGGTGTSSDPYTLR